MQNAGAGEVSAATDHRHIWQELCFLALPEADRRVGPHHPLAVGSVDPDRRVAKRPAPLHLRCVVVGVRERDAGQTAATLDLSDRLVVDQGNAVPEDVAGRRLDQVRALADADFRLGQDRRHARFEGDEAVAMVSLNPLQRRPLLPVGVDVLAVVQTDRTAGRRLLGLRILGSTGYTDVLLHRRPAPRNQIHTRMRTRNPV